MAEGKTDSPPTKKRKVASAGKGPHAEEKEQIKLKLQMSMPDDFFNFLSFLRREDPDDPQKVLSQYGLMLAGPYDILLHKSADNETDYFLHHRFFYDLPEYQTVLIGTAQNGYHIGYFRDVPSDLPSFLTANTESEGCKLTILGDNIFAAVYNHLNSSKKSSEKNKSFLMKLSKEMELKGYPTAKRSQPIKDREKKVVSRGFHTAGIVVPVDEQEVGWREVPRSIGELKTMFSSIVKAEQSSQCPAADELQELITYAQFANDECDYGQGLELGQDLFCYGHAALHGYIRSLMPMAYSLLGYDLFEKIILLHLDNRKKGIKAITYLH